MEYCRPHRFLLCFGSSKTCSDAYVKTILNKGRVLFICYRETKTVPLIYHDFLCN